MKNHLSLFNSNKFQQHDNAARGAIQVGWRVRMKAKTNPIIKASTKA